MAATSDVQQCHLIQLSPDKFKGQDLSETHGLLAECLAIMDRVDEMESLGGEDLQYSEIKHLCDRARYICRRAGKMLNAAFGNRHDMIAFAETYVPVDLHMMIDMYWDGIGDWHS